MPTTNRAEAIASIRWKLLGAFGALIFAVVLFQILYFPARQAKQATVALVSKAKSVSSLVAHGVAAGFEFGDSRAVSEVFSGAESDPDLKYLVLLGPDGKTFAALHEDRMPKQALENTATGVHRLPGEVTIAQRLKTAGGTNGTLLAGFSTDRIAVERRANQLTAIPVGLAVLIPGLILTFLIANYVSRRLAQLSTLAERLAQGDLTAAAQSIPARVAGSRGSSTSAIAFVGSQDEVGRLAQSFDHMAGNLRQTIREVMRAQSSLRSVFDEVGTRSNSLIQLVDEQKISLDTAYQSIEQLNDAMQQISDSVEALSALAEEAATSIRQLVASAQEISREADALTQSVDNTARSTEQMVVSTREVDRNVGQLREFVTNTAASMTQMNASISQIDSTASRSYELATGVAGAAESGRTAVSQTVAGMEEIRVSVKANSDVVSRLGLRSGEIGKILAVIDEVAQRTNLLALNAAILAAQAGQHGQGFSVVAGEIRDLSERTASSTREIAILVHSVQSEVREALSATAKASMVVDQGVRLSQDALRELNQILDLAQKSSDVGKEIAKTTAEQARSTDAVAKTVEQVSEMVAQISAATALQSRDSAEILSAIEIMRNVAKHVRHASGEQQIASSRIEDASSRIMTSVQQISEATGDHAEESDKIVQIMGHLREIADTSRNSANEMNTSVAVVSEAIRGVNTEVSRFKI